MQRLFYIALSILLFSACADLSQHKAEFQRVQVLLEEAPDSALTLLDSLGAYADDFPKSMAMRWQLYHLVAENRCDSVFLDDSILKVLVSYFDRHGSANERMTAHYLLGRAYSDMGEAPHALQCFQDAVSCADTTAADCDFYSLSGIYGQIACNRPGRASTSSTERRW